MTGLFLFALVCGFLLGWLFRNNWDDSKGTADLDNLISVVGGVSRLVFDEIDNQRAGKVSP